MELFVISLIIAVIIAASVIGKWFAHGTNTGALIGDMVVVAVLTAVIWHVLHSCVHFFDKPEPEAPVVQQVETDS